MKTTVISTDKPLQRLHSGRLVIVLATLLVVAPYPSHPVAWAQQGRPFSAVEIEDLIKNNVSSARVASLIEQRGVTFEITGSVRSRLQTAGASNNVIASVERASVRYINQRNETKRKEEEKRIAEERRRKLEEEQKLAEEKRRIEEVRRQHEEEARRAEIDKREREATLALKRDALVKKKSEQEAVRKEEEKKWEEGARKREQELVRLKKLEDARKIELDEKNPIASAPPCSVGLQHVFQYDDGTRFNRRIGRRDGGLCVIGQSYYDKDWTLVKQIGRNGQEITSAQPEYPLVGEKWLPFPLTVGKEWQINYRARFSARAGVGYFSNYFKVLSFEKVKTLAGTFAALKIRQEQRHGSGTSGVRYLWYASEVEYYVKQEYSRHESNSEDYWLNVRNYELVSVIRPKK